MKAYLIDTPNHEVVEVEYDGDYKSIYKLIRAELFCTVRINDDYDMIFVDDEGLINDNPHGWFVYSGYPQPLRGYGLVLGTDDEGESVEPRISLDELRAKLAFPDDDDLPDPEEYAHVEVRGFDNPEDMLRALFGERP